MVRARYVLVKYVPDPPRGEGFYVGVILQTPTEVLVKLLENYSRLEQFISPPDVGILKSLQAVLEKRFAPSIQTIINDDHALRRVSKTDLDFLKYQQRVFVLQIQLGSITNCILPEDSNDERAQFIDILFERLVAPSWRVPSAGADDANTTE